MRPDAAAAATEEVRQQVQRQRAERAEQAALALAASTALFEDGDDVEGGTEDMDHHQRPAEVEVARAAEAAAPVGDDDDEIMGSPAYSPDRRFAVMRSDIIDGLSRLPADWMQQRQRTWNSVKAGSKLSSVLTTVPSCYSGQVDY